MSIYQRFSTQTKLPVTLREIRDFILSKGVVSEIIRFPVDLDPNTLRGGLHRYYDIAPPYVERPLIARIGYPRDASEPVQRLICAKEMLHCFDPPDAMSPKKDDVERFLCDLLVQEAEREIGMAAAEDHAKLLNALAILLPRAALDIIRPAYKRGDVSLDQVAEEAQVPKSYVAAALTDAWRKVLDRIG